MISLDHFIFLLHLELYFKLGFKLHEKLKHVWGNLNGSPVVSQLYSSPEPFRDPKPCGFSPVIHFVDGFTGLSKSCLNDLAEIARPGSRPRPGRCGRWTDSSFAHR